MVNAFNGHLEVMKIRQELEDIIIKHIGKVNFYDKFFNSYLWFDVNDLATDLVNAKIFGVYNRIDEVNASTFNI